MTFLCLFSTTTSFLEKLVVNYVECVLICLYMFRVKNTTSTCSFGRAWKPQTCYLNNSRNWFVLSLECEALFGNVFEDFRTPVTLWKLKRNLYDQQHLIEHLVMNNDDLIRSSTRTTRFCLISANSSLMATTVCNYAKCVRDYAVQKSEQIEPT